MFIREIMNDVKTLLKKSYMSVCSFLFFNKNKIVFENFGGKGYGDNPKYIAEEILRQSLNYDLVWIVDGRSDYVFPKGIRTVKKDSLQELFELATAKFWIDNNRKRGNIYKSNRQIYIQTWHGFYPLKKIEKDAEQKLAKSYVENAKADAQKTDLMISGCKVRSNLYKTAFWYDGAILECGSPRNDVFFSGINVKRKIYDFLGITSNVKTLLYAPTFRENHSIDAYDVDYLRLIDSLSKKFGGDWIVLLKLHPAVREKSKDVNLPKGSFDVSAYDDIQELFCAADVLISDYSDVIFEYALTKKPVFIYASDMVEYIDERDFYYDIHELPFSISENNDELNKSIDNFDVLQYEKKIESFLNSIGSFEKGVASKSVVDFIKKNN